jgi:hypothetical protein
MNNAPFYLCQRYQRVTNIFLFFKKLKVVKSSIHFESMYIE